ncbi:hypothetical protein [Corticimicrobacter populi]|uniref:Uncharacterized protein n=1 Tax=Corticimicrobacter populi TaxID=2175229 RepID=A0A2V1K245_9BURK|nr:hypothetical protein [Corticimicrobacter populi]PWF23213.1 hypothetical protein DD235_09495 [Corticimicrobacter populi]
MEKLNLLRALADAGCQLAVQVPVLTGSHTVIATPEQALRLLQDKQEAYGELMGLNRTDYIEWLTSQGSVYCSATTQKGYRCRNTIVSATFLEPSAWKTTCETGGYCAMHAG